MSLLVALALSAAPPARSQPLLPPQQSDEIIVEGRDTRQRVTDYVDKVLPTKFAGQFGRFEDPICAKAVGLAQPLERDVVGRIRRVAKSVGLPVDTGSCTPNLIVIVTPDKKALIRTLRRSRPSYVSGVSTEELNRQAELSQPFAVWHLSEAIGADGMPIGGGDSFPSGSSGATDGANTFYEMNSPRMKTTVTPSRLRSNVKPKLRAAVVVVESGALRGATVLQLADFVLMRAMTPIVTRQPDAPTSSILGLFSPGMSPEGGPQSVSWWDVAFLKSLVNTRSDAFANIQRNEIRNQMIKEVDKAPVAER